MRECIVLAGGLGTRLSHMLHDLPKSLAPVAGKAFLKYIIDFLIEQKINHFIFSVGHKHEAILDFVQRNYPYLKVDYCIEQVPLGTGGAILASMKYVQTDSVFVVNSDTYYGVDFDWLEKNHQQYNSTFSVALKPMLRPQRYGTVNIDEKSRIIEFVEKKESAYGLINGGIYLIEKEYFLQKKLPPNFSLEKDFFEKFVDKDPFYGFINDSFFIDIGIPYDYNRSQLIFENKNNYKSKRALFLDRDGVINKLREGDYVKSWSEFEFKKDFISNISQISKSFDMIFVVTNQQCVEKGIISIDELNRIHSKMISEIKKHDVEIAGVYFCPHLETLNCNCRKPKPGMIDQIKNDYPNIDLIHSLMIGDSIGDMMMAKQRNVITVWVNSSEVKNEYSDYQLQSLDDFSKIVKN